MSEIQAKFREFLSRFFRNHDLQLDEDIFALGFVNSMFAMQLVLFIEQTFQINIDNEDLELDNFRTINSMTRLVERKTAFVAQK
ncbi:MAG: acyl carrier protein [Nostoc sp. DedQUE04]|uniref:acyl carrier protein n=1 Tax=Nostoc sp. DedQUE04 TaxID=3075390 RepID=UPI002AD44E86|nr:acyl carrier protein [Nostoc sp. DedQUE04]MDZ8136610.1 acyl carrier protein [Nostoc sp. DedQUE04]